MTPVVSKLSEHPRPESDNARGHCRLPGRLDPLGAGAEPPRPHPRTRGSGLGRRQPDPPGDDHPRRHRGAQGSGQVLHLFCHRLCERGRAWSGPRRLRRAISRLDDDLLDQPAARPALVPDIERAAPPAAKTWGAAPARPDRRGAGHGGDGRVDGGDRPRQQPLRPGFGPHHRSLGARRFRLGGLRRAAEDRAGAAGSARRAFQSRRHLRGPGQRDGGEARSWC